MESRIRKKGIVAVVQLVAICITVVITVVHAQTPGIGCRQVASMDTCNPGGFIYIEDNTSSLHCTAVKGMCSTDPPDCATKIPCTYLTPLQGWVFATDSSDCDTVCSGTLHNCDADGMNFVDCPEKMQALNELVGNRHCHAHGGPLMYYTGTPMYDTKLKFCFYNRYIST